MIPDSEPASDWNEIDFDDSGWSEGIGGFGYGDGDDGTVVENGTRSVYVRRVFSIENIDKLSMGVS